MSDAVDAKLQDAFDLIENNQLEDARNILEPLLESESNNPAVWWVYAHAVEDPEEGHRALDQVLQLDPTYPGASDLKAQVSATQQGSVDERMDDWDDLDFEPDSEFASTSQSSGGSPMRFVLIAIIVILIVVGIFAVLSGLFAPPAEPTAVANQANTEVPTIESQVIATAESTEDSSVEPTDIPATDTEEEPTDEPATATEEEPTDIPPTDTEEVEPTDVPATATEEEPTDVPPTATADESDAQAYRSTLIEALADYEISDSDVEIRTTILGETLDVNVCSALGAQSSITLNAVMDQLVEIHPDIPDDIEAVAVSLVDCENDSSFVRTIGVTRETVASLVAGEIELKDFQREWQPLP